VLHNFVGMYSHFLWTVAAAVLGVEVERRAASWPRWTVIALIGAVAAVGLSRNYVPYLTRYVRNIAAGKVVDSGRSPSKSKKSKKKNKKDKKKPRDKAST
jgi:heme/copper-type cytochrome/quinol oxidase subunit 1